MSSSSLGNSGFREQDFCGTAFGMHRKVYCRTWLWAYTSANLQRIQACRRVIYFARKPSRFGGISLIFTHPVRGRFFSVSRF
jgi:hypothetical protein